MSGSERLEMIRIEPDSAPLIHRYVGSKEYLNGGDRWIIVLDGVSPDRIRALPHILDRVQQVRRYRLGELPPRSKSEDEPKKASSGSRALADTPTRFHVTVVPKSAFLCVPENSSIRRAYVPMGWLSPPTIPSSLVRVVENLKRWQFGVLTSSTHMAWLRYIGGRLKSDYRYSIGLVYNPFPWPNVSEADQKRLDDLAQAVLDARAAHPDATLADLYDPNTMPADLRRAHRALDLAVDRLYRKAPFESDRERVEHLFGLYERMTAGLLASAKPKGRRRKA